LIKGKAVVAIIPARGRSSGIPKKNIRLLNGKPLIAYSIEAALKSKYINRVMVSTENEKIAKIAKRYGAEIIKRPEQLAGDETPTTDVIFHVLEIIRGYCPEVVVVLQPTSPLRTYQDINSAIRLFLEKNCESVVSVCEVEPSPYWSFKIEKGYLKPIFESYLRTRRQELPKSYMPNGAIYISRPEILHKYHSFYCNKTIPYVMPPERSVDIDSEIDLKLAELLIGGI